MNYLFTNVAIILIGMTQAWSIQWIDHGWPWSIRAQDHGQLCSNVEWTSPLVCLPIYTKGGKVVVLGIVMVQGGVHGSGPSTGRYIVRSPLVGHQQFIHACNGPMRCGQPQLYVTSVHVRPTKTTPTFQPFYSTIQLTKSLHSTMTSVLPPLAPLSLTTQVGHQWNFTGGTSEWSDCEECFTCNQVTGTRPVF